MSNDQVIETEDNDESEEVLLKDRPNYKFADLNLPYFKQGDDFGWNLENAKGDCLKALEGHAEQMKGVSQILLDIKKTIEKYPNETVEISGDTHCISISGSKTVIDDLISQDLADDQMYKEMLEEESDSDEDFEDDEYEKEIP